MLQEPLSPANITDGPEENIPPLSPADTADSSQENIQPSTSRESDEAEIPNEASNQADISAEAVLEHLRPFPKAPPRKFTNRGRKRRATAVLTDEEELKALRTEQEANAAKKEKQLSTAVARSEKKLLSTKYIIIKIISPSTSRTSRSEEPSETSKVPEGPAPHKKGAKVTAAQYVVTEDVLPTHLRRETEPDGRPQFKVGQLVLACYSNSKLLWPSLVTYVTHTQKGALRYVLRSFDVPEKITAPISAPNKIFL